MNMDRQSPSVDDYFVTALQIFDYCGADNSRTLRVDALMDKFAPFVKTNKAEYSCLKTILDPDHENPEINVTKLAKALHKYSETQKSKVDLDESFNLKSGQVPQDSDSGISTDGFQLLEELQCELREKTHLAHQLRSQLDFTDKQHEDVMATMIAERDSLRAHLNMLRDENMTLTHVKRDYEEACDRLCGSEQALNDARRELESVRKKARVLHEQVSCLENDKLTLQEQLTKSKEECHRINEMYAARQSALLEENETLKTEHADLASKLQDQEEFMQQIIKEKVLLEMELKDTLNKSNQTHLRMDRSIDISYTEDQMLTALDSLNADSRFTQENRLLAEDSFLNALDEDHGRVTNMSLFDEIRLSFYNKSRLNMTDLNNLSQYEKYSAVDISHDIGVDENMLNDNAYEAQSCSVRSVDTQTCSAVSIIITKAPNYCSRSVAAQTSDKDINSHENVAPVIETVSKETETNDNQSNLNVNKVCIGKASVEPQTYFKEALNTKTVETTTYDKQFYINMNTAQTQTEGTQTIENLPCICNKNNNVHNPINCLECAKSNKYTTKLETDLKQSHYRIKDMEVELDHYEENLNDLQKFIEEGKSANRVLQSVINNLKAKIEVLEQACSNQRDLINEMCRVTRSVECQADVDLVSVGTQAEAPCVDCENRKVVTPQRNLRRFFWEPIKCLFQIFAVICFICAISVLYGVTRRWHAPCKREPLLWRWFNVQDIMDLLLRIEYVSDVPM
ncbi:hypothetical protein K1T71_007630 [Dendrolimus kikuchii]|uniref:Uncharacterized protein n=1 Tax=Dendrolimus kikuchii TaxID=765133 RepID=A0ACC1CY04_9NEOP|nr:hypothetical protein K1T71_007630 [Dendrolimus kikuchii]